MPLEKRDPESKARLFVPTTSERTLRESQRKLNESISEVEQMKRDLKKLMDQFNKK